MLTEISKFQNFRLLNANNSPANFEKYFRTPNLKQIKRQTNHVDILNQAETKTKTQYHTTQTLHKLLFPTTIFTSILQADIKFDLKNL